MSKLTLTVAALLLALAGTANASTLDITVGGGPTVSGISLNPNVNLALTPITFFNATLVPSSSSVFNQYTAPDGGADFGGNYFAVFGQNSVPNNSPFPGTASFSLASPSNLFGFTWGSVDKLNNVQLTTTNGVFNFDGNYILNHTTGLTVGQSDQDVVFADPLGKILSVVFSSVTNSFEVANVEEANAPLPSAVVLFGFAMLGLFVVARCRQFGLNK